MVTPPDADLIARRIVRRARFERFLAVSGEIQERAQHLVAVGVHSQIRVERNDPADFRFRVDPERFAPERAKKRVKYSYLPFAAGKRSCIGGALSQIENTLALVQLLRRFTPEYAGPVPAKIHATVTLCPKGGLPFRIRELS